METEYKGDLVPVILYIPDNTVKLTIDAKIMNEDDTLSNCQSVLSTSEVIEARIDGENWEVENVKYVFTDSGGAYLDELETK